MVEGSRVRRKFLARSLGEQAQGELLKKKKIPLYLQEAPVTQRFPLLVPQRSVSLPAVCPKLQLHFWGLKTKQETVQNNPDPVGDRCLGACVPSSEASYMCSRNVYSHLLPCGHGLQGYAEGSS